MNRISQFDLPVLPRLNIYSAIVLAEQLLTAAAAEHRAGLPALIDRSRLRLEEAVTLLQSRRAVAPERDEGPVEYEAERALYDAWRLFEVWLVALAAMPIGSMPAQCRVGMLYEMVFGDGLSAAVLSCREELLESEARLSAMEEGGYEPLVEQLGGSAFLTNIKISNAKLRELLETVPARVQHESVGVRDALFALIAAVKDYTLKVTALSDPDLPGTEPLSAALLSPLADWPDLEASERDTVLDDPPLLTNSRC